MAAECDNLSHGRSFVAQIGQGSGAKVVESQWAFYTRPFADLTEDLPESVFAGVRLARHFGCSRRQVRLRWWDGVVSLWERLSQSESSFLTK